MELRNELVARARFIVLLDLTDFVIEQREVISRAQAEEAKDRRWQNATSIIDGREEF